MTAQKTAVFSRQEIEAFKKQGFLLGWGQEEFILRLSKEDFDFEFFKRVFKHYLENDGNVTYDSTGVRYGIHRCGSEGCCR